MLGFALSCALHLSLLLHVHQLLGHALAIGLVLEVRGVLVYVARVVEDHGGALHFDHIGRLLGTVRVAC